MRPPQQEENVEEKMNDAEAASVALAMTLSTNNETEQNDRGEAQGRPTLNEGEEMEASPNEIQDILSKLYEFGFTDDALILQAIDRHGNNFDLILEDLL
jgi:hypothetical protein